MVYIYIYSHRFFFLLCDFLFQHKSPTPTESPITFAFAGKRNTARSCGRPAFCLAMDHGPLDPEATQRSFKLKPKVHTPQGLIVWDATGGRPRLSKKHQETAFDRIRRLCMEYGWIWRVVAVKLKHKKTFGPEQEQNGPEWGKQIAKPYLDSLIRIVRWSRQQREEEGANMDQVHSVHACLVVIQLIYLYSLSICNIHSEFGFLISKKTRAALADVALSSCSEVATSCSQTNGSHKLHNPHRHGYLV